VARRRTARSKEQWPPKAPFEYGQTVKIKLADGSIKIGKIWMVGWILFPGMHSFDVDVDGEKYSTHGNTWSDKPGIKALTDDLNEEL